MIASRNSPSTLEGLSEYQVILLSDIGANSLLLPPAVWLHGKPVPNRLKLIREWTRAGGGLVMAGGYFSFQGIDGKARWRRTPVEEALPVTCLPYDDRLEIPEGFQAARHRRRYPSDPAMVSRENGRCFSAPTRSSSRTARASRFWPSLPEEEGGHPLLVTGSYGKGRTVAWTLGYRSALAAKRIRRMARLRDLSGRTS